jgi:hypothetical protein
MGTKKLWAPPPDPRAAGVKLVAGLNPAAFDARAATLGLLTTALDDGIAKLVPCDARITAMEPPSATPRDRAEFVACIARMVAAKPPPRTPDGRP